MASVPSCRLLLAGFPDGKSLVLESLGNMTEFSLSDAYRGAQ
jgi:hypothetical protein